MTHEGGCFCGAVRYRAEGPPSSVAHCHCSMCRRTSGAAFVTWATFPVEAFHWTKGRPKRLASSAKAERQFCPQCGTALTFRFLDPGNEIDVTVSSLDAPETLTPTYHIWASSRLPWVHLDDGLPQYREWSPDHRGGSGE